MEREPIIERKKSTSVLVGGMTGIVKHYNENAGYGFIAPDDVDLKDVFIHITDVKSDSGHNYLRVGQQVKFLMFKTSRGLIARELEVFRKEFL